MPVMRWVWWGIGSGRTPDERRRRTGISALIVSIEDKDR